MFILFTIINKAAMNIFTLKSLDTFPIISLTVIPKSENNRP